MFHDRRYVENFTAILGHVADVSDTFNSGLPAIFFRFHRKIDADAAVVFVKICAFLIFPKKILAHGIMIDDKSDSNRRIIELRYATNREQRNVLESVDRKKFDLFGVV